MTKYPVSAQVDYDTSEMLRKLAYELRLSKSQVVILAIKTLTNKVEKDEI